MEQIVLTRKDGKLHCNLVKLLTPLKQNMQDKLNFVEQFLFQEYTMDLVKKGMKEDSFEDFKKFMKDKFNVDVVIED